MEKWEKSESKFDKRERDYTQSCFTIYFIFMLNPNSSEKPANSDREWVQPSWITEQLTSKISLAVGEAFKTQTDAMIADGLVTSLKNQIDYGLAALDWMLRQAAQGKIIVALDVDKNSYKEFSMPPLDRARELGDNMTWNKIPAKSE